MKQQMLCISLLLVIQAFASADAQPEVDARIMHDLKTNLVFQDPAFWSDPDPCKWEGVQCINNRVKMIQLVNKGIQGSLLGSLYHMTELQVFEVTSNNLTGPVPKFPLSVQVLSLSENQFSYIPLNFFGEMTSLETLHLGNNLFDPWTLPKTLSDAVSLKTFTAIAANITGKIPGFLGAPNGLANLTTLHFSYNHLEGGLPIEFASSSIQSLWLNGYESESKSGLDGSIDVLKNMTSLVDVRLQGNRFTGSIPDLSGLTKLENFDVSDNLLTGPVPDSLTNLLSLKKVALSDNLFQGKRPLFWSGTIVDDARNHYCVDVPGVECDQNVNLFLKIAESMKYPIVFADTWVGNDPCSWRGINCTRRNVTEINFQNYNLYGTIAPEFSQFTSLQKIYLNNNSLTGTIPDVFTEMPSLVLLDVSFNDLSGLLPIFMPNVVVKYEGTNIVL